MMMRERYANCFVLLLFLKVVREVIETEGSMMGYSQQLLVIILMMFF